MATSAIPSTTFQGAVGRGYGGTSTTPLLLALGDLSFTTQAGMAYQTGARIRLSYTGDPFVFIEGVIQTYIGTTMTMTVKLFNGAGTYDDWAINIAGDSGIEFVGTLSAGDVFAVNAEGIGTTIPIGAAGQVLRVNESNDPPFEYYTPVDAGVTAVTATAPLASTGGSTPVLSIAVASTSAAGSMSATDKTKLNGIAAGAQVNPSLATQIEAEAGTDSTKIMPANRVKQAITAQALTKTLADAKGDLFVGTGSDTVSKLSVGANGKILAANSAQSSGLEWIDPPSAGTFASQAEAEAGSNTTKYMNPLRTAQAIAALGGSGGSGGGTTNVEDIWAYGGY